MSSLYARYIYAVRDANEVERPEEWNFKSDVRYGEVLEHTPVEFAVEMLKWSIKVMPGLDLENVRIRAGFQSALLHQLEVASASHTVVVLCNIEVDQREVQNHRGRSSVEHRQFP